MVEILSVFGQVVAFTSRTAKHPGVVPVVIEGVYGDGNLRLERIVSGHQVQKRITLGHRERGK